jgi:hypothetical protein
MAQQRGESSQVAKTRVDWRVATYDLTVGNHFLVCADLATATSPSPHDPIKTLTTV